MLHLNMIYMACFVHLKENMIWEFPSKSYEVRRAKQPPQEKKKEKKPLCWSDIL